MRKGRGGMGLWRVGSTLFPPCRELPSIISSPSEIRSGGPVQIDFCTIFGLQITTGGYVLPTDSVSLSHRIHYVMTSYMTPISIAATAVYWNIGYQIRKLQCIQSVSVYKGFWVYSSRESCPITGNATLPAYMK